MPGGTLIRWAGNAAVAAALALAATEAAAEDGDAALPGFGFRGRLEWITAAAGTSPRDTAVNPRNAVLRLPQAVGQSELRPDLRVEHPAGLAIVARPRLLLQASKARVVGAWVPEETDATSEWLELYGSWRVDERVSIAYGLQNFQWGPAELMSPSNRIFHETGFARDPLYVVRGKHLARVNVSVGQAWSAVLLAEVRPNDDTPFVAGEPFEPKAEAKLEWAAPSGRGYLGVTGGAGRRSRGFFGEYGAMSLGGFSIYGDAVHQAGSRAWYPVLVPGGGGVAAFDQTETRASLRTLALGGARYTFEGGADVRLEILFDEAGWDRAQLALASRAAGPSPLPGGAGLLAAWLLPGFEIVGRQHAYASVRLPDLPPRKRLALQARYLAALEDGSGAAFVTASFDAADSVVLFASAAATHGAGDAALSRLVRGTAAAGAVVSW